MNVRLYDLEGPDLLPLGPQSDPREIARTIQRILDTIGTIPITAQLIPPGSASGEYRWYRLFVIS